MPVYLLTLSLFLFSFNLAGCVLSNGPLSIVNQAHSPSVNYLPIGIPFIFGGHGTSIPITQNLSLTAKHVATQTHYTIVAAHPDCDIAIIQENNSHAKFPALGLIYPKASLSTYGKDMIGNLISGEGKYFQDVHFLDSALFQKCPASITDAPVQSGMSGGGVFNQQGELVGIISGLSNHQFKLVNGFDLGNQRTSIFVPIFYVKEWLIRKIDSFYQTKNKNHQLQMSMAFKKQMPNKENH